MATQPSSLPSGGTEMSAATKQPMSSLEIAQEAKLEPIDSIAERIGLEPDEVEPYGRYKAKINLSALDRLTGVAHGKLICVAGVTPTRAGEGKTTTSVALTQGLG